MSRPWRLIVDQAASGPWNMSVDEALLTSLQQGLGVTTLRFYRWLPATVSLGYFQNAADVDLAAIDRLRLGLVRRPTGGRAILHDDELTYSLVVPAAALPGGRSVGRSYLAISSGLLAGLELLGVGARVGQSRTTRSAISPGCFALSTRADLTAAGRKIIGSAQTRRRGFILQHGSIPLTLDVRRHEAVFGPQEASAVLSCSGGVADLLGRRPTWEELVETFVQGFRQALGVDIEPGEITRAEQDRVRELEATQYATDEYTLHTPGRSR